MSHELQIPFDHRNAPLIRAVICGDTTGSTLLLTVHHAIADAISLTWVFRDVLLLLSGRKLKPLAPPVSQDEMLGNALRAMPEKPARTLPPARGSDASFRERLTSCALARAYSRNRREGALAEHDGLWRPECGRDFRRPLVIQSVADGGPAVPLPRQFQTSCRISESRSRVLQYHPAAPGPRNRP
jgi:hypothetical protein